VLSSVQRFLPRLRHWLGQRQAMLMRLSAGCRPWQSIVILVMASPPLLLQARVVSVPDLHGDYDRAVQILSAANLIDPQTLAWVGGAATLVQTGDIVDRGDNGLPIYKLFRSLSDQAQKAGGAVVNLIGNHELMNIQEDLRYVTDGDAQTYGGWPKRSESWSPGGELGSWLRKQKAVAKVGRVLFVHAGLHPSFLEGGRTIDDVNKDFQQAIAADGHPREPHLANLLQDEGPVWTRFFAEAPSPEVCTAVSDVLKKTDTVRMVVGHTIQVSDDGSTYRAKPVCEGSLILGDTGISRAYGGAMSFIEHDGEGGAVAKYPAENPGEDMLQFVLPGNLPTASLKETSQRVPESPKLRTPPKEHLPVQPTVLQGNHTPEGGQSSFFSISMFMLLLVAAAFIFAVFCLRGRKQRST